MLIVEFNEKNKKYLINAKGHAGYTTVGQDIICAAVSSLLESFSMYLEEYDKEKGYQILRNDLEAGKGQIEYIDLQDEVKSCYEMVLFGVRSIALAYPTNVYVDEIK